MTHIMTGLPEHIEHLISANSSNHRRVCDILAHEAHVAELKGLSDEQVDEIIDKEHDLVQSLTATRGGARLAADKLRLVIKRMISGDGCSEYAEMPVCEREDMELIASALRDLDEPITN